MVRSGWIVLLAALAMAPVMAAESCIPQSQIQPQEREAIAQSAANLATWIQANDASAVRAATIAEFRQDFNAMGGTIAEIAPKLAGTQAQIEQVYVLDASTLTKTAAGANPDAQFFCNLNKSQQAAEFTIPQLPPGVYAFVMVRMDGANPWRLSMLLRQEGDRWLLAGLYPRHLTAGGHDGLWYWKQARALSSGSPKEPWSAWLYYLEAETLLLPAEFVTSSHLDKLQEELQAAVPSAVSGGLSADSPLVVKGADGAEYRFTSLSVEDSLPNPTPDVSAHIKVDTIGDSATARKRNVDAIAALVAAHPELRKDFHGVWIFADAPGQQPYATEVAMNDIK